jgi:hypothetical protein
LDIKGVDGLNIRTTGNTDMNIDAQQAGGFAIKSQYGSDNNFVDFTCAIGFFGHVEAPNGFAIYDNRTGATQTGIVYAADYSTNYVSRSLVDKQYVDTVATGLNVHQAVFAATTSGITLSGSPQTIDGVSVTDEQRVLVKNQGIGVTGSPFNGIYIVTGTTWFRAPDYDNIPPGEVSNGDLIPVTSGLTQNSSLWALASPNPITINITPLIFTEFSTIIDVQGGNGICVTQSGGVHVVNVQLGSNTSVGCGLAVNTNGLCVNAGIAGRALSYSTGVLNVNVATGGTISSIPVRVNAGNCLVVNCSSVNAITGATNGLSRTGQTVVLGGNLIENTCINTSIYNLIFTGNTLGTPFGVDIRPTEVSIGDYNSTQLNYIYHTQPQTKIFHGTTGFTGTTYNSSLCLNCCNTSMRQEAVGTIGNINIFCGFVCMTSQCNTQLMCALLCPAQFSVSSNIGGNHCFCVTTGSTIILHGTSGVTNNQVFVDHHLICLSQAYTGLTAGSICMDDGTVCLSSNIINTSIGSILLSGNSMTIAGNTGFRGLRYLTDNSANFVARSLPDVAYVTGKTTTSGIQTACNGLTKVGTNVCLGGSLIGTTTISGAQIFSIIGTTGINLSGSDIDITGTTDIDLMSPAVRLITTPLTGTMNDPMLVWNQIDKKIKIISGNNLTNNIYSKTIITTSTLLTTGSSYVILVSGTSITITLPSSPSNGQAFKFKDVCGNALTSNIIIDSGAGRTIDGSRCAIINTNYGAMEVMFGATCKWFNLSFIN